MFLKKFSVDKSKKPTLPLLIRATFVDFDIIFILIMIAAICLHFLAPISSIEFFVQEIKMWLIILVSCFGFLFIAEICIWSLEYRRSKNKI